MAGRRSLEAIEQDYREARKRNDSSAIARLRNEEACVVLLTLLGRLAADESSFIHEVALKGGILMAGELGSPRVSADIDATTGQMKRMDDERIVDDLRAVGRDFGVRQRDTTTRTPGGSIIHLSFESRTDRGMAKLEVSVREDLVFPVRDAFFDVSDIGLDTFSLPGCRSRSTRGGGPGSGATTSTRSRRAGQPSSRNGSSRIGSQTSMRRWPL